MKRVVAFTAGVLSVAIVIRLGFLSVQDPGYVLWFGLAAALVAPIGLGLLSYALFGTDKVPAERLSKVPEIAELIERADTEEERLRLLEIEKQRLEEFVRYEAERMTLESRKASWEDSAQRVLSDLNDIEVELDRIAAAPSSNIVSKQVRQLRDRLQGRSQGRPGVPSWRTPSNPPLEYHSKYPALGRIALRSFKGNFRPSVPTLYEADQASPEGGQLRCRSKGGIWEQESMSGWRQAPNHALADGPAPPEGGSADPMKGNNVGPFAGYWR